MMSGVPAKSMRGDRRPAAAGIATRGFISMSWTRATRPGLSFLVAGLLAGCETGAPPDPGTAPTPAKPTITQKAESAIEKVEEKAGEMATKAEVATGKALESTGKAIEKGGEKLETEVKDAAKAHVGDTAARAVEATGKAVESTGKAVEKGGQNLQAPK
jgi:hypothetical protein